jgi:hypothetical protein
LHITWVADARFVAVVVVVVAVAVVVVVVVVVVVDVVVVDVVVVPPPCSDPVHVPDWPVGEPLNVLDQFPEIVCPSTESVPVWVET